MKLRLPDFRSMRVHDVHIRSMSLRTRIGALTAGAVAVAVFVVASGAWAVVRHELLRSIDASLNTRAFIIQRIAADREGLPFAAPRFGAGGGVGIATQIIDASGNVVQPIDANGGALPVARGDKAIASSRLGQTGTIRGMHVGQFHLRVATVPLGNGTAAMIAMDLNIVDSTLARFALLLAVLCMIGVAGAALAGYLVARRAVRPVEDLTDAAEEIARTKELDTTIEVYRSDELGRLAGAFNTMLAALETSREQQRRLVADASHELRTPLTSVRTNVEVLLRQKDMDPAQRDQILNDLRTESEELSSLVAEIVQLATETRVGDDEDVTDVRLDEIVAAAADRARRRSGRTIEIDAEESPAHGRPLALERAVANIIDNACKWSPPDMPIEVTVRGTRVDVRDHGPGIDPPDQPFVFDRFYRATSARSMPGSGLGLAIVGQVVESHGGRAWAKQADGGGAVVGFELPRPATSPDGSGETGSAPDS